MFQKQQRAFNLIGNNKGFTLVEMAIVLIIIGIIIGAIVKGKDLVKSAEQKKVYSKFLNEWRLAYLNFYDRTGKRLGDFWDGSAEGQDSKCDTDNDGGGAISDTERGYLKTGDSSGTDFRGLDDIGLGSPVTNTGNAYEYSYNDSSGSNVDINIAFTWENTGTYNYMEITTIPNELALAIDTMVDGQADGTAGDFLNGSGGSDWGDATDTTTARWKLQF